MGYKRIGLAFGLVLSALPGATMAASTFTKIVDTYTKVPGTLETFNLDLSTAAPAISGNKVVFLDGGGNLGCNAGHVCDGNDVWTANDDGTKLTPVLTTRTPIPGMPGQTFRASYGTAIQIENGMVVVLGITCGGCNSGVGYYTVPASGGTVKKLVDWTQFSKHAFPIDFHAKAGQVVFQNNQQVYAIPLAGGPITRVAGTWDAHYSPPSPYCCIFDTPDINDAGTTVALRAGNVFGHGSVQTVNRNGNPLSFKVIANKRTGIDEFEVAQPVIDGSTVVYRAKNLSDTVTGIYAGHVKLVDTNTPVPGGTGNFQCGNCFDAIVAKGGIVVFHGYDAAGHEGLYKVDETGKNLAKIISYGDPIGNGFKVWGVRIGAEALEVVRNASGQIVNHKLVFYVGYQAYRGSGVYEVTLP